MEEPTESTPDSVDLEHPAHASPDHQFSVGFVAGTQPGADAPATENAPDKGVTPKKVHVVVDSEGRAVPITPLPDYPGGAVSVNRLEFIANVNFRLDDRGLPCALAPQEEPSPLVTTVGNIWRAAQGGVHPGFKPPSVLRKPTFVSKTVQEYGKRLKWDNKTLDVSTPEKLAAVLNDDEHVLASCWLRLKCGYTNVYGCPGGLIACWSWHDLRNPAAENLVIVFRRTLQSINHGDGPGLLKGCIHPQGVHTPMRAGRSSGRAELASTDPSLSLAHSMAEVHRHASRQPHRTAKSKRPSANQQGTDECRKRQKEWGEDERAQSTTEGLLKLSEEYASLYEADAFGGEGEADHARTLRTRLLVGAGGAHDTWMNTSDLDVRTMVTAIKRLGWKFTAGLDVSGQLIRDRVTKQGYLMAALNVYGGPAGDGFLKEDGMKRPDGGGSFTPFWFFSPSFNTTTFMIFLLKMLELIHKVTGSPCPPMASLMCDHDWTQLKAVCRVFHSKSPGEYFCALRAALLQGASLQPLWPIIIHDGFHSAGKVRHWNRKHLSGPQNKYRRMLLIVIIRAYNMFGHPRLYPFVATDYTAAQLPLPPKFPEPDDNSVHSTPQYKNRLARLARFIPQLQQFCSYVLLTEKLPFKSDNALSFGAECTPLDLADAHDHPKQFPKSGVWPAAAGSNQEPTLDEAMEPEPVLNEEALEALQDESAEEDGVNELEQELTEAQADLAHKIGPGWTTRTLALQPPWMGAPPFYVEMSVGCPDDADTVKARVVIRVGELRLATRNNKTEWNVVSVRFDMPKSEAEALRQPPAPAAADGAPPFCPAILSVFYSAHAAWYHCSRMATQVYACSYVQGRQTFTAGSSGQEEPFKKIKAHRQAVFKSDKELSVQKGVRLVSGNFLLKGALQSAGFQRRNVLSYIDLQHGLGEAADTPPAGLLPVAEGSGKEDIFVSWGRSAAGAKMPPEDRDLAFRLFKIRYQHWPKLGLRVGGGWNNLWNLARFSVPSAVQCLPIASLTNDENELVQYPLLNGKTLSKFMSAEWCFDSKVQTPTTTVGKSEKERADTLETTCRAAQVAGLANPYPCFMAPAGKVMTPDEVKLCKELLDAWASEAEAIVEKRGTYMYSTHGDLVRIVAPTQVAPRACPVDVPGLSDAAGPSSAAAHSAGGV